MSVTLEVSKPSRLMDFRDAQPLNIPPISVTFEVLNVDRSTDSKALHFKKRLAKLVAFEVSKQDKSTVFKERHSPNMHAMF